LVALFGLWVADPLTPHLNCVFYCGFYSENGINKKSKKRKRSSFLKLMALPFRQDQSSNKIMSDDQSADLG
jgi:hypothetical protein